MRSLTLLLYLAVRLAKAAPQEAFTVKNSDVYQGHTRVKFKGIGLTCTEYMSKPGMDDAGKGEWPGHWAYNYCFGGPPSAGAPVELNKEPEYVMRYLRPDSQGGVFHTAPPTKKVTFPAPMDKVVNSSAPEARPITRMPLTGSMYLYDDGVSSEIYREIVDKMVQYFTSRGVVVILDLHWNCPDSTSISGCTGAQAASMALKDYGGKPGSLAFWDAISKKYASNSFVFYELFNEPWLQEFDPWYAGDAKNAGMKEMYETVRKNDPEGIVVIGGKDQYALDAQSGLSFYLQYKIDTGSYPTNILWNIHPYSGAAQGLEHSLRSAMQLALALKTVGPVIFTEFGQYCCGGSTSGCQGAADCKDQAHGANFVHNIVNMAEQYDISWIGWAWRGTNVNNAHRPCQDGMAECHQPDIRDIDASGEVRLTDGSRAGPDWSTVWSTYVTGSAVAVQDVSPQKIGMKDAQPAGFLPRPCMTGQNNLGNICGWDSSTDVRSLSPSDFKSQSIFTSILPGLPGHCTAQSCEGYTCGTYTGPCSGSPSPSPPAPSPKPTPPSPQPPTPPGPSPAPHTSGQCCWGAPGAKCASLDRCQGGFCGASEAQCTNNCKGTWCAKELDEMLVV